jgi:hypothetical protein
MKVKTKIRGGVVGGGTTDRCGNPIIKQQY